MSEETGEMLTGSNAPQGSKKSLERAIGAQVRTLRRSADLSIADLATAADMSPGMLSKIENGTISASPSSLDALSTALAVPITTLFAAHEDRRDCSFVEAGHGVVIQRRGTKVGHVYNLLGHSLRGDVVHASSKPAVNAVCTSFAWICPNGFIRGTSSDSRARGSRIISSRIHIPLTTRVLERGAAYRGCAAMAL